MNSSSLKRTAYFLVSLHTRQPQASRRSMTVCPCRPPVQFQHEKHSCSTKTNQLISRVKARKNVMTERKKSHDGKIGTQHILITKGGLGVIKNGHDGIPSPRRRTLSPVIYMKLKDIRDTCIVNLHLKID